MRGWNYCIEQMEVERKNDKTKIQGRKRRNTYHEYEKEYPRTKA